MSHTLVSFTPFTIAFGVGPMKSNPTRCDPVGSASFASGNPQLPRPGQDWRSARRVGLCPLTGPRRRAAARGRRSSVRDAWPARSRQRRKPFTCDIRWTVSSGKVRLGLVGSPGAAAGSRVEPVKAGISVDRRGCLADRGSKLRRTHPGRSHHRGTRGDCMGLAARGPSSPVGSLGGHKLRRPPARRC